MIGDLRLGCFDLLLIVVAAAATAAAVVVVVVFAIGLVDVPIGWRCG